MLSRRKFIKTFGYVGLSLFFSRNCFASSKEIYLTIDDGPRSTMKNILDLLGESKATFFVVGRNLFGRGFDLAKRALEEGHLLGNHTYSHPSASKINLNDFKEEILKTNELIEELYDSTGIQNPNFFRFPYGDEGNIERFGGSLKKRESFLEFLSSLKYRFFGWDFDTFDWRYNRDNNSSGLINRLFRVQKNQVVLTHDLKMTFDYTIPFLIEKGFVSKVLR